MTNEELDEGYLPNCGFCLGGSSHIGDLSPAEPRLRCNDLERELLHSPVFEMLFQAHDAKRRCVREVGKMRIFSIATRDRVISRIASHAMLRWEEGRMRRMRT